MPDYETLSGPATLSMESRIRDIEWQDGDIDGVRVLDGEAGQVHSTIHIDREPPTWSATVLCMDQAVGGGHFTQGGESLSISSAKIDSAMAIPALLDKVIRYLTGELEIR